MPNPGKQVIEAKRGPTSFIVNADDPRLVIIEDENHPLYDERIKIPLEDLDGMMHTLARGNQFKNIIVRKNGEFLEVVDGRQEVRVARWINKLIREGDARVSFRMGNPVMLSINVRRFESIAELVAAKNLANARIHETPSIQAANIIHDLKFLSKEALANCRQVTVATLEQQVSVKDLDESVQGVVDSGVVKPTIAVQMVKRGDGGRALSFDEQKEVVQDMISKGATKGSKAAALIRAKKKGTTADLTNSKKMFGRVHIEKLYDAVKEQKSAPMLAIRGFIEHILQKNGWEKHYPPLAKLVGKLNQKTSKRKVKKV